MGERSIVLHISSYFILYFISYIIIFYFISYFLRLEEGERSIVLQSFTEGGGQPAYLSVISFEANLSVEANNETKKQANKQPTSLPVSHLI